VGPISGQGYGCAGMPDFYAAQRGGTKKILHPGRGELALSTFQLHICHVTHADPGTGYWIRIQRAHSFWPWAALNDKQCLRSV